jgi:autotransporter-associated beta strand protein
VATTKYVRTSLAAAVTSVAVLVPCVVSQPALGQASKPAPITSYDGDPGRIGDPASWRTPEFMRDTGLLAMGAEYAYAAGYSGTGVNIGIVDSGFFAGHVREHGSYATNYAIGDRYHSVTAQGGHTGPTPGYFDPAFNDTHGTHVSGTVGASRDGVGDGTENNMQGVAFDADIYLGNTHKTDGTLYGQVPPGATEAQTPDNGYLENVYKAVNGAKTKNGKRINVLTTSWGSPSPLENYNTYDGLEQGFRYLATPDGVADANGNTQHWLNGAISAAKTGTVLQFTAGNSGYANPTPRGATPYFQPDLEGHWFTTSGINPTVGNTVNSDGSIGVPGTEDFNQCGVAEWSCVTGPSNGINSTVVNVVDGVPQAGYRALSGTSMGGPHTAAALALVMQRFPYMTNEQALYTMFTTGRQNATVSDANGNAVPNPTAGQMVRVPDTRNGWHTPSLREAMQGPGQLLGVFDLDLGRNDVWSNDISDVAIRARRQQDAAEAATWTATKNAKGWTRGLPADASDKDKFDYATGMRREKARDARVYQGVLDKRGNGTLFLTGNDTWHGTSTVSGGKLSVVGSHAASVDVRRSGTLGGTGTVIGDVDVAQGALQPGVTAAEAGSVKNAVTPGNVLSVGGDVRIGKAGKLAATISAGGSTSVRAGGDVVLGGSLRLDTSGPVTQGSVLTITTGKSIRGTFNALPEGAIAHAHGHQFKISYRNNSVTLTALR